MVLSHRVARLLLATLAGALAAAGATGLGCSGREGRVDIPRPDPPTLATIPPEAGDEAASGGPETPKGELAITPMASPPPPERIPKLSFVAPKPNEAVPVEKADAFEVRLDIKDWFIEPGDHVHLVLDNKPYKALEDPKATIKLGDVFPAEPLAEGSHVLTAFPARATHLTIKPERARSARPGTAADAGPFAVVSFWIGKAAKTPAWKAGDPMLVYSRPKGTYNGADADDLLLDFYLANVDLGEGRSSIRATVSAPGREPMQLTINRWTPFKIQNLPSGSTKVLLELCDKDGKALLGTFSRVEREISVNRDAK